VRALARQCAERYIEERAEMGYPLLEREEGPVQTRPRHVAKRASR
jgi:glycyl-tRNA synthetase alpha chain